MPRTRLLIIQPSPFCNINCSYCYLPNRSSKAVIEYPTLWNLFSQLFASGWLKNRLEVVWHAGEPMVLPIDFYIDAFRLIDRLSPPTVKVVHHLQTNGTLIDDNWCDFFRRERISVGVSIDGPKHIHDRYRVTRSGRGTFEKTVAGIRLLRKHQIPFHVISVISTANMASPREMFEFYVEEGIERVAFNVEDTLNHYVSGVLTERDSSGAYYRFLKEFWALARSRQQIKAIREIDQMVSAISRPLSIEGRSQMAEPFEILNIDCSGNISTFSPELMDIKNETYGDFILGNINCDWLIDLPAKPALARMLADIEAGVGMCRSRCPYFDVCGGGEPANKLSENGTFLSAETRSCRLTRMTVADVVLNGIDAL
jgi:uncharacterized protein